MSALDTETIERDLRSFLTENFPLGADAYGYSTSDSLIEVGAIDSTGVLELIEFLESRYGLQIPDADVLPENLDSIENISRYVLAKHAG